MSLHAILQNKLKPESLMLLPRGYEVIGDIAIINIPPALDAEKYLIAEALSIHRKDIKTVLRKMTKIDGDARVPFFEFLLGNNTTTVHRENGCIFHLDVAKTFFSGKLYYERDRISRKVNDGENVLVLFAGVGPFLILIKKIRNVNITGLDNNKAACEYLRKNLELNRVEANVILGDARAVNNLFRSKFDRIIMPAPYGQDFFLDIAQLALRPKGHVHFYTFKKDFELLHFRRLLEQRGCFIEFYRDCGNVAPRVKRYAFDLELRSGSVDHFC